MSNEQLSAHFKRKEFACQCGCGYADVDMRLVEALEKLRAAIGNKPITISSGCRCEKHNKAVKGAAGSQHLFGKAADIKASGVNAGALYKAAEGIPAFANGGMSKYSTFIHVDVGPKRRW